MNQTILLVDDDVDEHEIFQIALQSFDAHMQFHVAGDGVEALELLTRDSSFRPSFIFLDINMPKMNGMECLPELRKIPSLKDSKIIMYSTSIHKPVIQKSRDLGADDFLIKPFKIAELAKALNNIIKKNTNDG